MESDTGAIVGRLRLEPADIQRATQHMPEGRRVRLIVAFMTGCLPLLISMRAMQGDFPWETVIPMTAVLLGWVVLTYRGFRSAGHKALAWKDERQREMTYVFTRAGWDISNPASVNRGDWSTLHHWLDTPSTFLLYVAPNLPIAVPKRAFADADVERLRALLEACLGKAGTRGGARIPFIRWAFVSWIALILMFVAIYSLLAER